MKLEYFFFLPAISFFSINTQVIAQITPDNSLGNESSRPTRNQGRNVIEGGATRGNNLFHSFKEFNIRNGKNAYFANPKGIENIFTRITGNNRSKIFGILGVLGKANLFLINPNGIIFGNQAKLDLKGSFFASSADSIVFDSGFQFSASQPDIPPLLIVNIPVGFSLRDNPGNVKVNKSYLKVRKGQSLSLLGGNIGINNSQLQASEGTLNLGAVAGNNLVTIEQNGQNSSLYGFKYQSVQEFKNISISGANNSDSSDFSGTLIKTGGQGGGAINLQGRNVNLSGKTLISSNTQGNRPGAEITILAEDLTLTERARIFANTGNTSQGNGSSINVQIKNLLIRGQFFGYTGIFADAYGEGKGGNLTLKASEGIKLSGGNGIFTSANSKGDAGNLTITTPILKMTNGFQVASLASLDGKGKAGNVTVNSSDSIKLLAGSIIASQAFRGDGGNLDVITNELIAKDGSQIGTSTFGAGNSGDLFVKAKLIKLIGTDGTNNINPTGLFSQVNIDEFNPNDRGNGGSLTIDTGKLILLEGAQILTSGRSTGNAGNLTINATDAIIIKGSDPSASLIKGQSAILATIEPAKKIGQEVVISTGNSGNIDITTDKLIIEDGGKISADTFGPRDAGNINLNVNNLIIQQGGLLQAGSLIESPEENVNLLPDGSPNLERGKGGNININAAESVEIIGKGTVGSAKIPVSSQILIAGEGTGEAGNLIINTGNLTLKGGGRIDGRTASGTGGNMEFNGSNLLLLKSGSIIATADNNGDGGNITINTQFLIGENSNITANAFEGRGGNINITATGIYLDRNSTITASSEYGEDGIVETNTPAIDPTRGILNFSSDVVDAADLIANNFCEKSKGSDYVVTGKGGIPTTPYQDSGDDGVWVDLVEPVSSPHPRGDKTRNTGGESEQGSSSSKSLSSRDIVPANGWIINAQGKGIFVGYDPTLVNSQRGGREIVCEGDTANFD